MMSPAHARYSDEFKDAGKSLAGSHAPWVRRLREPALEIFLDRGFPDTHVEAWKYTDLRGLARHHFSTTPRVRELEESPLQSRLQTCDLRHRLVFIDGHHAPELSAFDTLPHGVTLCSLAFALLTMPEELESRLGSLTDLEKPGFNAFNTAFMSDGAYLRLAAGTRLEQPLHLLYIATGKPDAAATLRNVIVANPHSRGQIVESFVSLNDGAGLTSTVTELFIGEGADIEHCKLELESESAYHMAGLYVSQQRGSRCLSHNATIGGRVVRNDIELTLDGPDADCTLNGLSLTHGRQHVDNQLSVDHRTPRATSRQWYKGVLDERSRTVFTGRVIVHPDAQQTDAAQSNHNLLLSNEAEADARPQLEIHADDVKCSHGCTVGRLDEEALFYLRTRAIDPATARNLLVQAFAADVLQRMEIAPVRRYIEERLVHRLGGGAGSAGETLAGAA
jgi:Fe-S cluster assembly protein SufD